MAVVAGPARWTWLLGPRRSRLGLGRVAAHLDTDAEERDRGSSRSERRTAALAGEGDGDDKVRGGSDEEEADVAADGAKRPDLGQGAHRGSIPGDGEGSHESSSELHVSGGAGQDTAWRRETRGGGEQATSDGGAGGARGRRSPALGEVTGDRHGSSKAMQIGWSGTVRASEPRSGPGRAWSGPGGAGRCGARGGDVAASRWLRALLERRLATSSAPSGRDEVAGSRI